MTYQCRAVLNGLKELSGNTDAAMGYAYESTEFCLLSDYDHTYNYAKYREEISSILLELRKDGYLIFVGDGEGRVFSLTQKAIHKRQISTAAVGKYVLDNWIAFLALVVSIVALIRTFL